MTDKLGYKGIADFYRPRNLTEDGQFQPSHTFDRPKPEEAPLREGETVKLFDDLAKTYIKGYILKTGLSKMEPAQYIPIDQTAEPVVAGAKRLFEDQSRKGTIITYSMFQTCVDSVLEDRWKFRKNYLNIKPQNSVFSSRTESVTTRGSGDQTASLIKEFLEENGIAGTIMAVLVASPFQSLIFQSLSPEESAAKAVHFNFALAGIAFLIELGIKAERIYNLLKKQKLNFAITEDQIVNLENDSAARAAALSEFGVDREELKQDMKQIDSQVIIDYVSDYYQKNGGLLEENSNLTLDHWLAYKTVAYNQQLLRGALNTADKYTDKYREFIGQEDTPEITGPISANATNTNTSIHLDLASTLKTLNQESTDSYNDIVRAFNHYITDGDLCCLVSIFGTLDTELLRTIALILRILAVDLGGEFIRLDNILRRWIAKKLQAAIFEILEQLNTFYHKIDQKLTEAFTIDIDGLPFCSGLLSIGLALMQSLDIIHEQIRFWIRDIQSAISDFGSIRSGSWEIAADRIHLVGIAKVLEVMATRIDVASYCKTEDGNIVNTLPSQSNETTAEDLADQVISQIIESPAPVLAISKEDLNRYFPNVGRRTSRLLKYSYGPGSTLEAGQEQPMPVGCQQALNLDSIAIINSSLGTRIKEVFYENDN